MLKEIIPMAKYQKFVRSCNKEYTRREMFSVEKFKKEHLVNLEQKQEQDGGNE